MAGEGVDCVGVSFFTFFVGTDGDGVTGVCGVLCGGATSGVLVVFTGAGNASVDSLTEEKKKKKR